MKLAARIFIILSMIAFCPLIYPIVFGAIALHYLSVATCQKDIKGWGIATIFLCSIVGGILMLLIKDNDFKKESEMAITSTNTDVCNSEIKDENILRIEAIPEADYQGFLNSIFQCFDMTTAFKNIEKTKEYVIEIPAKFRSGFDAGNYKFMKNLDTGGWRAVLTDEKGTIVSPALDLKAEEFIQGDPSKEIFNNFHNLYIQQKLHDIKNIVESTQETVERIEAGQTDDRIGHLKAGIREFFLALDMEDQDERDNTLNSANSIIRTAQGEIFETFKRKVTSFKPLPKGKIKQFFKEATSPGYLDKRDDEYDTIQEYFGLYLMATKILAGIRIVKRDLSSANKIFTEAEDSLNKLDYSKLKTIEHTHRKAEFSKIYMYATDYLLAEQQDCQEIAREYDYMAISISGEYLLEAMKHESEVSSTKTQ